MKYSVVLFLVALVAIVQCADNICKKPTTIAWGDVNGARMELGSNGDINLFPGAGTPAAMTFVGQRNGGVKFVTPVVFGSAHENDKCPGLVSADSAGSITVVVFDNTLFSSTGYFSDDPSDLIFWDLVRDANSNTFSKKRNVEVDYFYKNVKAGAYVSQNAFAVSGVNNYFFSENNVIKCITEDCTSTSILSVNGEIVDAFEENGVLAVLCKEGKDLKIHKVNTQFEITETKLVNLDGEAKNNWKILSSNHMVGTLSQKGAVKVAIVSEEEVTVIDTFVKAEIKASQLRELTFITVHHEEGFSNYICRNFRDCKKVTHNSKHAEKWDVAVGKNLESTFAFANGNEINVVTCNRFDCKVYDSSIIEAPGKIASVKVSRHLDSIKIVYSLENGATAIATCLDSHCSKLSLTRASDLVSSNDFAFFYDLNNFVLFGKDVIQSFSSPNACPKRGLCFSGIAGNHFAENGEVLVCNQIPQDKEGYSEIFFWTPAVTSLFKQF